MLHSPDPRLEQILNQLGPLFEQNRLEEAEAACLEAVGILEELIAAQPDDMGLRALLASMRYNRGNVCSSTERTAEAEAEFRAALAIQEQLVREDPTSADLRNHQARTHFNLGNACLDAGRWPEAEPNFLLAQTLWIELAEEDPSNAEYHHEIARSFFNLAYIRSVPGREDEAVAAYQQAQTTWRDLIEVQGEEVPWVYDLARAHFNRAVLFHKMERPRDAEGELLHAAPLFDNLARAHPTNDAFVRDAIQAQDRLIDLFREQGRVGPFLALLRESAAMREEIARERGDMPGFLHAMAMTCIDAATWLTDAMEQPDEAEPVYRQAIGYARRLAREQASPETLQLLAAVLFDHGSLCRMTDRPDTAEESFRRAADLWERLRASLPQSPQHVNWLAGAHNNLGILYADTGRFDRAETAYHRALGLREGRMRAAPDDLDNRLYLGGTCCNLGNVAVDRGEAEIARDWFDRSIGVLQDVLRKRPGDATAQQFLTNATSGLARSKSLAPHSLPITGSATMAARPPGPPPVLAGEPAPDPTGPPALDDYRQGRYREALAELDRFLAAEPGRAEGWFWRSRCLARLGSVADALQSIETCLDRRPSHFAAQIDRADLLRCLSRPEEALVAIDAVLARDPARPEAWHIKGLILGRFLAPEGADIEPFDVEQHERAVDAFDEAILLDPEHADARLFKARTLVRLAHALQAHLRALGQGVEEQGGDRNEALRPFGMRFHCCCRRACESFDAAARLRSGDSEIVEEKRAAMHDLGVDEG